MALPGGGQGWVPGRRMPALRERVGGGSRTRPQRGADRPGPAVNFWSSQPSCRRRAGAASEMVHRDAVVGKLAGFDRLIFKGHLIRFYPKGGMKAFLDRHGVLVKDFGTWAKRLPDQVKAHAQAAAARPGRPY